MEYWVIEVFFNYFYYQKQITKIISHIIFQQFLKD